jgi:hypothetical protein
MAPSLVAAAALLATLHATLYPYLEARLAVLMTEKIQDRLLLAKRGYPTAVIETAGAAGIYLRESLQLASALLTTLACGALIQALIPAAVDLSGLPQSLQWWPFLPFVVVNLALWVARTARPPPLVPADAVKPLRRYHFVRSKLLERGRQGHLPSEWTFGSRLKPLYSYFRRQLPRQARNLPMKHQGLSAHELAVGTVTAAILVVWFVGQLSLLLPARSATAVLHDYGNAPAWLRDLLVQVGLTTASKETAALAVMLLSLLAACFSLMPLAALPNLRRVYSDAAASLDAYFHAQSAQTSKNLQDSAFSTIAAADLTAGVHVTDLSVAGPRGPILQVSNRFSRGGSQVVSHGLTVGCLLVLHVTMPECQHAPACRPDRRRVRWCR